MKGPETEGYMRERSVKEDVRPSSCHDSTSGFTKKHLCTAVWIEIDLIQRENWRERDKQ